MTPRPYTYGYLYTDNCVRFNGGREVNGGRPVSTIALYDQRTIDELVAQIPPPGSLTNRLFGVEINHEGDAI